MKLNVCFFGRKIFYINEKLFPWHCEGDIFFYSSAQLGAIILF